MSEVLTNEEVLVSTDWAENNLEKEGIRFVEVDVDTECYDSGHIPGAVEWNWKTELQDPLIRDVVSRKDFEKLLEKSGIGEDTTIIVYGDNNNWFAAWAYWLLKYYGHRDVKILDGGRKKWLAEDRRLSIEIPEYERSNYNISMITEKYRTYRNHIHNRLEENDFGLVDVRSPEEFRGEIIAPEGMKELSQRAGHIPGASDIPWSKSVNDDGTFKNREELKEIYEKAGITPDKEIVVYCRIGERSAHSWVVLHELLEYPNVKNYDGSWTEWGNLIGVPIEKGG